MILMRQAAIAGGVNLSMFFDQSYRTRERLLNPKGIQVNRI
jgi:hypothetical protein